MKKRSVILFSVLFLAVAYSLSGGSRPAQAQGLVEHAFLQVEGTLGQNGIYVSDVSYSWLLPTLTIPESIVGCESGTITDDTPADGIFLECFGQRENGTYFTGALVVDGEAQPPIIHRDTTPPQITLLSPNATQVQALEGSSLYLEAVAQDAHPVTLGWDLDEDGVVDAPNPTSAPVPGNISGSHNPSFIVTATDAAGNVSRLLVEVTVVNLAPTIDRWVVPTMVHFNGEVQMSAAVSDPGDHPLSAVVHWGDGLVAQVPVQADGSLQAAHTYATSGDFEVMLQVQDGEGGLTEERRLVNVEDPIQSIESRLIPGALALVPQGILNEGQADSLVVKLQGAVDALNDDRPAAPQKLDAYLNEYVAVVPNGLVGPCFLIATDIRDGLLLHGIMPQPD